MRTLTQREHNRALPARQLLLDRGRMPLPKALERVGGIQARYAPSTYIGVWSRLEGLERETLTRALERRTVIQAALVRHTIRLVSKADFRPLALAVRQARREHRLRATRDAPSPQAMAAAARAALDRPVLRRFDGGLVDLPLAPLPDPGTPAPPRFLIDGQVAGTWRYERASLKPAPFGSLHAADRRALKEEADRLAELHA